ncbi:protein phosphatase inhibitor domain-containing protein [Ditylenchus destructor]|uniref:E3 ubiquitin-protein ligase PPP1R11 n=1 Tax=Ditylenchus destructor TaxID=166010 RepID=A0AAD4MLY7_9BILA|nr:protein phosphatase inhibitor domain-containing protein [Ditylenchus destructor]
MNSRSTVIYEDKDTTDTASSTQPATLVLRLRSPPSETQQKEQEPEKPHRRVTFTPDTIDNEHLGRLKSNCCCIYVKPRVWDDPSTWEQDENETEHCRGHTIPIEQNPVPVKAHNSNDFEKPNDEGKDTTNETDSSCNCCH